MLCRLCASCLLIFSLLCLPFFIQQNMVQRAFAQSNGDFEISCPSIVTTFQQSHGQITCSVTPLNGFDSQVSLSMDASSVPSGVSLRFDDVMVTLPAYFIGPEMNIAFPQVGNYIISITGISGSISHTAYMNLVVKKEFTLTSNPPEIPPSGATTMTGLLDLAPSFDGYRAGVGRWLNDCEYEIKTFRNANGTVTFSLNWPNDFAKSGHTCAAGLSPGTYKLDSVSEAAGPGEDLFF